MKCDCSPINILIVEDNPGDVRLIKEILGEYRIINGIDWAMDGEEALNKIREGNYHLVIMDMHLPRMNGMEIINAIKSNNECSLTKFAIMAGDGSQIDHLKEQVPHADAFIEKPFTLEDMSSMVSQLDCFGVSIVNIPFDPAKNPCPKPGL